MRNEIRARHERHESARAAYHARAAEQERAHHARAAEQRAEQERAALVAESDSLLVALRAARSRPAPLALVLGTSAPRSIRAARRALVALSAETALALGPLGSLLLVCALGSAGATLLGGLATLFGFPA